ncbi:MAG TPA: Lsr2 family protein [Propionibacterium sp.]|jgi:hypothetical protein|nr:Lsr2 family protein [Propionibacterium sp.]
MAQRIQIILEDDIDGTTADETIRFGLDGVDYEIDLSVENAEKLRDGMAQWVGHARKVSRGRGTAANRKSAGGASPTEIRAWAKANGFDVSSRGRVPTNIREAFEAAQR